MFSNAHMSVYAYIEKVKTIPCPPLADKFERTF